MTMEFTAALKKALELGFTKQEFLRVWTSNSQFKSNSQLGEEVSDFCLQMSRNHINEVPGCKDDETRFFQRAKEELSQDLSLQLEQLFDKQTEKLNFQWELAHSKNKQMSEIFLKYFEVLSEHVSNTVENQGNILKHHLMQEFDLLKHNFAQLLDEYNFRHVSEPKASTVSQDQMPYEQNTSAQQNFFEFGSSKEGFKNLVAMPKQKNISPVSTNEDIQPGEMDDYDWSADVPEETFTTLNGREENFAYDDVPQPDINSKKSKSYAQQFISSPILKKTDTIQSTNHNTQLPTLSPKQGSTEATGFFADFISNQFKQNSSSEGSQSSSKKANEPWISARDKEALKPIIYASIHASAKSSSANSSSAKSSSAKSSVQKRLNQFTITKMDTFSTSGKHYLSPFMHLHTQSWKAQMCVKFNATQQLKVFLLISKGDNDSSHDWPLQFIGTGYIYHEGSREFTQIWQIPGVICQRPSGTAKVDFPAEVCLSTLRGTYPDVKYKELEYRKYTTHNQLTFQWDVKAKKYVSR